MLDLRSELGKSGTYTAGTFLLKNSETTGCLATRLGVFLTKARVKTLKVIEPRLPF